MEVEMKLLHHEGMEGNVCSIASVTQSSMLQNKSPTQTHTVTHTQIEVQNDEKKGRNNNHPTKHSSWAAEDFYGENCSTYSTQS